MLKLILTACVLRDKLDVGDMDANETNATSARLLTAAASLPSIETQASIIRDSACNDVGAWLAERRVVDVCLRPIRPDGSCAGNATGVWKLVTNSGRVVDQSGCE